MIFRKKKQKNVQRLCLQRIQILRYFRRVLTVYNGRIRQIFLLITVVQRIVSFLFSSDFRLRVRFSVQKSHSDRNNLKFSIANCVFIEK